jgi:ribose transport system substrate-binding protein
MKNRSIYLIFVFLIIASLAACAPGPTPEPSLGANAQATPEVTEPLVAPSSASNPGLQMDSAMVKTEYFNEADYAKSMELIKAAPINPDDPIYLQYLVSNPTDISHYPQYASIAAKKPPYNICFSNAGIGNAWRLNGYITMREQVEELRTQGLVKNFYHFDVNGDDNKQISDIEDIIKTLGKCDLLIVAAGSSKALTPIIEKACAVMPVVQFDRFAQSDCPVVSERPDWYGFGITGAQKIVDDLGPAGGNVLAFRILPGIDVLEQRWGAARKIFEANPQINVIGVEFDGLDSFKADTVMSDYLAKYGHIDAVWTDAGGSEVSILKAFKNAGAPYPNVIAGEDQQAFLDYIKDNKINGIAATDPTFQWRTAVLAAIEFLQGKTVQHNWVLPQPAVTTANLDQYTGKGMPPTYFVMSGAEDMKNWPDAWKALDPKAYEDEMP